MDIPNVAEYNAVADNIETAYNRDILAFSFDKGIDSKLREINRCIALKTAFGIDWLCEMMRQREEPFASAKLLACLNRSENDMAIKTNDPCFSDFIFAFMRMNNLQSCIDGKIYNKALMEFSPKGMVAEIDIPIDYIKHMHLIVDSFANFLDKTQGFYLLEKRIYKDKYQWEQDLRLLVKSMASNLAVLPNFESFLDAVLRRSDRRRKDEIEPFVREALKEGEGRRAVDEHREWIAKMSERKQAVLIKNQEEEKPLEETKQEEKLSEEKQPAALRRRTIFDKYPAVHKRRKIGEE